jgi:7,8-dihydropterin-6-yl-methyl-4-(beta-D-ribofuranosyl)aminobenzene 5'-phosphate synthase
MITRAIVTVPLLVMIMLLPIAATGNEGVPMQHQDSHTELKITIVYDNTLHTPGLTAGWGFSALIEYGGHALLFDTGADGQALLNNMAALHINPLEIESVVLSHNHSDHTGGLNALLATGVQPNVYLLPSFPPEFKQPISQMTTVIETASDQAILEGIFTTGEMGGDIPEQAIAIEVDQGLVMLTGCAHPGIVPMIEHVKETTGRPVYLVLGGFHLKDKTLTEITAIVQAFRRLGVEHVGPCHCTGEQAITAFAEEYGDDFVQIGTGKIIEIESPVESPSG